jgi:hypothetical protein
MAKEWDKFQADYKKLAPKIKKYSTAEAAGYSKRVSLANANCTEGQNYIADCMVTARKNGVTGSGLNDFVKDKGFKDALGVFDKSVSNLQAAMRALSTFSDEAGAVAAEVGKLHAAIAKDLKSRKDNSASKKDIQALMDQTEDDQKDLIKASKTYDAKMNPSLLNYAGSFQKIVAAILKQAPAEQAAKKEAEEVPMLFVDRNIKKNRNVAIMRLKQISEHCDEAFKLAEASKDAMPALKKGAAVLKELKDLNDSYNLAVTKYKDDLNNSKDKAKIVKMIADIGKSYAAGERTLRGMMATIKKAG